MDQARDDIWAIEHRHSVRRFTGEAVPADVRAELERAVAAAKCGYFGEKIVLLAQRLGLNSCWVGGTFSRKRTRCDVGAGEKGGR